MYFDRNIPKVINTMFNINMMQQEFIITFFVLFVDEILLVIDTKILKLARDINREYVGEISDNKVIPLIPSVLVYIIFISRPNILVIQPPIISISVDFINLFFVGFSPL